MAIRDGWSHFFVLKVLIHLVDCRESIIFVVGKQFELVWTVSGSSGMVFLNGVKGFGYMGYFHYLYGRNKKTKRL